MVDFPVFDADNHYYEPKDAFTRHLDPKLRGRAMQWAAHPREDCFRNRATILSSAQLCLIAFSAASSIGSPFHINRLTYWRSRLWQKSARRTGQKRRCTTGCVARGHIAICRGMISLLLSACSAKDSLRAAAGAER